MSAIRIVLDLLKVAAPVANLVPKTSLHPIAFPQGSPPPAIVVNKVGGRDEQLLGGAAKLYEGRVRLECLALNGNDAVAISEGAQRALESVVKATVGTFTEVDIFYLNDFTDESDDRSLYRSIIDFSVRWRTT